MGVDLFQSRRTYNVLCQFWSRNEDETRYSADELVHKRVATGTFYAKEISGEEKRGNVISGTFLFDSSSITIKSPDDCSILKSEDVVEYEGDYWIIRNVQKRKARIQQSEFARDRDCSHYWYIDLRK